MKKLITLLSLSALALMGCDAKADSQSANVGNPDSSNMLIIQEGYEVVAPVPTESMPAAPAVNNSGDGASTQPVNTSTPPQLQPQPQGGAVILENVSTGQTPGEISEEIDEEAVY